MSCNRCNSGCNPCSCNSSVKYCGKELCCLDIEAGDSINSAIYKIGEWVCEQNDMESTYINLVDVPSGEVCPQGGVTIQVRDAYTDSIIQEYTLCNSAQSSLTTFLNGSLIGNATEINIDNLGGLQIQASNTNERTSYTFKTYFELTYSEAQLLKSNGDIIPNCKYFITDKNITLKGLSTSEFAPRAVYVHRCPKEEYYDREDSESLGVYSTLLPTASLQGKVCVFGARVWRNMTGNIGNYTNIHSLDSTNYSHITEADDKYYENVSLDIIYDIDTDFITEYKDNKGNTLTVDPLILNRMGESPTRYVCDWLQPKFGSNNISAFCLNNAGIDTELGYEVATIFSNSECTILNNISQNIVSNQMGIIRDNVGTDISSNICNYIYNNRISTISCNTVLSGGGIRNNILNIGGSIFYGRIENNISNGIVDNSDVMDISDNYCPQGIIGNNSFRFLKNNKCIGIFDNVGESSGSTLITHNTNSGGIYLNILNNADITWNSNNGDIGNSSSATVRSTSVSGTVINL